MYLNVFIILILCALGLYIVKHIHDLYQKGVLFERLENAAKKALRFTLQGVAAIGAIMFALSQFSFIRAIGFALLPADAIEKIRHLMELVLETKSVYAASQMLACVILLAVEFSLIFSFVGFFVTKTMVLPQKLECSRVDKETAVQRYKEIAILRADRKIFLNFADLRI